VRRSTNISGDASTTPRAATLAVAHCRVGVSAVTKVLQKRIARRRAKRPPHKQSFGRASVVRPLFLGFTNWKRGPVSPARRSKHIHAAFSLVSSRAVTLF
jgi:hypothetical protein